MFGRLLGKSLKNALLYLGVDAATQLKFAKDLCIRIRIRYPEKHVGFLFAKNAVECECECIRTV
jgi:hypothetical protein